MLFEPAWAKDKRFSDMLADAVDPTGFIFCRALLEEACISLYRVAWASWPCPVALWVSAITSYSCLRYFQYLQLRDESSLFVLHIVLASPLYFFLKQTRNPPKPRPPITVTGFGRSLGTHSSCQDEKSTIDRPCKLGSFAEGRVPLMLLHRARICWAPCFFFIWKS